MGGVGRSATGYSHAHGARRYRHTNEYDTSAYLPGGDLPLWLHHKSRESGERSDGRYETVLPVHSTLSASRYQSGRFLGQLYQPTASR